MLQLSDVSENEWFCAQWTGTTFSSSCGHASSFQGRRLYSRSLSRFFFWSAPTTRTLHSQSRKSANHGIPALLRILWNQTITVVDGYSTLPLPWPRALLAVARPKEKRTLGMKMDLWEARKKIGKWSHMWTLLSSSDNKILSLHIHDNRIIIRIMVATFWRYYEYWWEWIR